MAKDPDSRIGIKDKELIKLHPFFDGVDWDKVLTKEYAPPQLGEAEEERFEVDKGLVRNILISSGIKFYFHEKTQFIDHDYDDYNMDVNRVKDFSFSEY